MKFNRKILLLFIVAFVYGFSGGDQDDGLRTVENRAFKEGEKLTFNVNYGFVTAGVAVMEIPRIKRISGREAYHVKFRVNTVPSFDWFFKVRDRYETYIDVKGIFPWRFEQHIREGKFKRDFSAFFDQRKSKAKTSDGEYKIPPYVNDIISAFYYARILDYSNMKVNDRIHMQNFYKNKVYDLDVKYLGKETIEVPGGKYDCIKVEPLVKEGGLFKHDGNIIIWLTDDQLKVPLRIKTKIVVGYVDVVLTNYEGLAGKLTVKK